MPISTITGKPVPTSAENILQTKDALRTIGPAVGDIAGTLAAQAAMNTVMPGSGAAVPFAQKILPALLRYGAKTAGAGVGGAAGEYATQQAFGEPTDMGAIGAQGLLSAGGEAVLGPVGGILQVAKKPALELMSDLTVSGSRVKQFMGEKLKKIGLERADRFVADIAPDIVKNKIDQTGINQAVTEAFDANTALYNHFKSVIDDVASKNEGYIPLQNTTNAMQEWVKEKVTASGKGLKGQSQAENDIIRELGFSPSGVKDREHVVLRRLLRGEDLNPQETNFLLANLYEKKTADWLKIDPAARELRQTLKETLLKDLETTGAGAAKASADVMFKELKQYQSLKNLYDTATTTNKETLERAFSPGKFIENLNRSERMIRSTMPEVWTKLQKEVEYYRQAAESIAAGGRNLGGLPMLAGLASSAFTGGMPVAELFGAGSAWALMSPAGKKTLEGVFKYAVKPAAKVGLHVGGEVVNFNDLVKSH
jgi:hypothetical protein